MTVLITDNALASIREEVLAHEPERGGALLGIPGHPIITEFILDVDAATTAASYTPSAQLTPRIHERERMGLEHKGILHSHPGAMWQPSGQDLVAFADSLARNPHLASYVVPIANTVALDDDPSRLHLDEGTVTFWSARFGRDARLECTQLDVEVIPIARCAAAIASAVGGEVRSVCELTEIDGRSLLMSTIGYGECMLRLVVSGAFPIQPPLLFEEWPDGELVEVEVSWSVASDPVELLGVAVRDMLAKNPLDTTRALPSGVSADQASPPIEPASALMQRSTGLLPSQLVGRRVLLVGCGSVGSWMADGLVRSGVGCLDVIDPDRVEPHNLGRTAFGWDDIGSSKVTALAARLSQINRDVVVAQHDCRLEDLVPAELFELVTACDLVIAATDDPAAQRLINRFAFHAERPALFPGVYKRASGGEVVIVDPATTGCYQCATSIRHAADADGDRVHVSTDYGTGRLEAEVGLHADIQHVTTAALKLALSLLSRGTDASAAEFVQAVLDRGASYLVMGLEPDYWFFDEVFATTPGQFAFQSVWMNPEADPDCPICGAIATRTNPLEAPTVRPRVDFAALRRDVAEFPQIGAGDQSTLEPVSVNALAVESQSDHE